MTLGRSQKLGSVHSLYRSNDGCLRWPELLARFVHEPADQCVRGLQGLERRAHQSLGADWLVFEEADDLTIGLLPKVFGGGMRREESTNPLVYRIRGPAYGASRLSLHDSMTHLLRLAPVKGTVAGRTGQDFGQFVQHSRVISYRQASFKLAPREHSGADVASTSRRSLRCPRACRGHGHRPRAPFLKFARKAGARANIKRVRPPSRLDSPLDRPARLPAVPMTATSAQGAFNANPFPDLPAIRSPDAGSEPARRHLQATRLFPRPRFGDYSRTRFESRVAFGGPDDTEGEGVEEIATPTRQFSLLEITRGLPDDSREADERAAERRLRDLRGRVKAARAAISATPGGEAMLRQNWAKAAHFYARFGVTEGQLRTGVAVASLEFENGIVPSFVGDDQCPFP